MLKIYLTLLIVALAASMSRADEKLACGFLYGLGTSLWSMSEAEVAFDDTTTNGQINYFASTIMTRNRQLATLDALLKQRLQQFPDIQNDPSIIDFEHNLETQVKSVKWVINGGLVDTRQGGFDQTSIPNKLEAVNQSKKIKDLANLLDLIRDRVCFGVRTK